MSDLSAYTDHFAADNLPRSHDLPEFLCDLPELDYPVRLNAAVELLDKNITAGRGDKIAIRTPNGDWTYRALLEKSNQIAHVLVTDMGLKSGNRVLLRSANNPMMVACWFAVLKAGGIAVSTMPLLRARDLIPMITKAEVAFALCDYRLKDELEQAVESAPVLKNILWFNGPENQKSAQLEGLLVNKSTDFTAVDTAAKDVALIAFTSGTTGKPKGTLHFHQDIMSMCHLVGDRLLGITEDDVIIGSPPLAFTFGLGALVGFPFHAGATTVLLEAGTPDIYLESIARFRATWSFTAPTAYRAMLENVTDHDLSCLKACVSAGEHLPLPTFKAWEAATGLKMIDGIGATELIHIFISATGDDIRPGATGKPIAGYQACILDKNDKPLPAGEVGRLAVKGPTGCKYLADDRQTTYVRDGWNVTGDSYRMDEEGYFWFQARDDDMIVSSGYNIGGPEVEEALMDHLAVAECAVVASPDVARGQIVKAFVCLSPEYSPSEELIRELQKFVKSAIAPYKYPRAIEFVASLPKTETGKIQRFVLRQKEISSSSDNI